ncbi:MAG TPA: hypothetical protein PKY30_22565 [Myxococcota bacterium]|nr:hypothetical protein [Myxococcota bacterium]
MTLCNETITAVRSETPSRLGSDLDVAFCLICRVVTLDDLETLVWLAERRDRQGRLDLEEPRQLARLLMWDLVELRQGQDAQPELHPTRAAYRLYEWLGEKQKTLTQQGA